VLAASALLLWYLSLSTRRDRDRDREGAGADRDSRDSGDKGAVGKFSPLRARLYLSLAVPELLRCMALMLQLFDDEPLLLLLLGLLAVSLQVCTTIIDTIILTNYT
jgi:hypothetical protein